MWGVRVKKILNQQRKTEDRIEKMYWEIMWWRARIDLTAVWDADLACWSCRFRTYLAWAGFYRRARHPHGSWRGGRPLSPAAATSRQGSAPHRATSRWSVTRGCWAGAAPGSRAEGFLSEEKETTRLRRVIVNRRRVKCCWNTQGPWREREDCYRALCSDKALLCFIASLELNRCSLNNTWIYWGPRYGPVQWGSQRLCWANFSSSCQNANYTLKQRSLKVLRSQWIYNNDSKYIKRLSSGYLSMSLSLQAPVIPPVSNDLPWSGKSTNAF